MQHACKKKVSAFLIFDDVIQRAELEYIASRCFMSLRWVGGSCYVSQVWPTARRLPSQWIQVKEPIWQWGWWKSEEKMRGSKASRELRTWMGTNSEADTVLVTETRFSRSGLPLTHKVDSVARKAWYYESGRPWGCASRQTNTRDDTNLKITGLDSACLQSLNVI